jgi:hypothetical protein
MRKDAVKLYEILQRDDFKEEWLCEVAPLKKEAFIIYDEEGALINGNWHNQVYPQQKPNVRVHKGLNYAIYDTRYNQTASIGKKYSEFVHEMFHCFQIRMNVVFSDRKMVEGAALLVESIIYSRYTGQSVDEIIEEYGKNMSQEPYMDYFLGAKYILEKLYSGYSWKDYFSMKM